MFADLEEVDYNNRIPDTKVKGEQATNRGRNSMSAQVIEGIVNFSHITAHDEYPKGQSTGKFSMTITMDQESADSLASRGVKIKDYEGNMQRRFSSKFDVKTFDSEGNPFNGEVPRYSKVRLKYKLGPTHPVHGVSTYLDAVKVLEVAERPEGYDDF